MNKEKFYFCTIQLVNYRSYDLREQIYIGPVLTEISICFKMGYGSIVSSASYKQKSRKCHLYEQLVATAQRQNYALGDIFGPKISIK